jgi:hypothetical protein
MSLTGLHLRLKRVEDLVSSPLSNSSDRVYTEETLTNALNTLRETSDLNITKVTEVFNNAIKELSDTVKTNDIFDSLELVKEKISVFENELVIIKDSFSSSLVDIVKKDELVDIVKKDELVDLFAKLEKLEKTVDKITTKQEGIIKRIVTLESK